MNSRDGDNPGSAAPTGSGGVFTSEGTPLMGDRRSETFPADGAYRHGTFSPRPETPDQPLRGSSSDGASSPGSGTRIPALDNAISNVMGSDDWKRWLRKRMRTKKMGQSSELAEQAGIRDTPLMFVRPHQ